MIIKAKSKGYNPPRFLATYKAPVDLIRGLLFSIRTNELKSFVSRPCFSNNNCPVLDCRAAKLNLPLGSFLIINCTVLLQRLHTPSNNTIKRFSCISQSPELYSVMICFPVFNLPFNFFSR